MLAHVDTGNVEYIGLILKSSVSQWLPEVLLYRRSNTEEGEGAALGKATDQPTSQLQSPVQTSVKDILLLHQLFGSF